MNAIVFDIGGTNLRVGFVHNNKIAQSTLVQVPRSFSGFTKGLLRVSKELAGIYHIDAVSGGLAGSLSAKKTTLTKSTHLAHLVKKPMQKKLQQLFHAPVLLENDNVLVGLGEANFGAGKGHSIVAYIGIGTGIGGSRIIDGNVDRNAHGFEPGHHFLNYDIKEHKHISAHPGDWESLVSGTGMKTRFGKKAEDIHSKKIWNEMAYLTALGLINVAMFWSPDILVVGGSLMKSVPFARVRFYTKKHQKIFPAMPPIVQGKLGDFGGLYGALRLLQVQSRT